MTDIPPGRYRIIERNRRIIVTDTWADGGRPKTPIALNPGSQHSPPPPPPPLAPLSSRSMSPAPRADANVGLLWLRGRLIALVCLGATNDAGRRILTTHAHFDEKGPRNIVLHGAGAARLGNWLLVALAATLALVIGSGFSPFIIVLAVGGLGLAFTSTNGVARPAITRWLDGLGDAARR